MRARVLVFGTFDVLHPGHIFFLEEASRHGEVYVSLTTDELIKKYKGITPKHAFAHRKQKLERIRYVSQVHPSDAQSSSFAIITKVEPEVFFLGYDQRLLLTHLRGWIKNAHYSARILTNHAYRPELYHSSKFRDFAY